MHPVSDVRDLTIALFLGHPAATCPLKTLVDIIPQTFDPRL
jgi:hypothetical protein